MSSTHCIVISLSNRPLGLSRMFPDLPVVPIEYLRDHLDLLIGENKVHRKELGTGELAGYIQDVRAALDVIEHFFFLYVETSLSYGAFLNEYAIIPEVCPVCQEGLDFLDSDERLEHIIRCRWNNTRSIVVAVAKAMAPPRFLH